MIDPDLAQRAKAGDRGAVNELLRRSRPALRRIIRGTLASYRCKYSLHEDALAEAMEHAWRALSTWEPERGSLATYVRPSVQAAARRLVAYQGHAVDVPDYAGEEDEGRYAEDRARATRVSTSMEATYQRRAGVESTLREMMAAPFVDPAHRIDAKRVLDRLDLRDAAMLMRVAEGATCQEIANDIGCARQNVHRESVAAREAALRRLEHRLPPEEMSPEGAVLFMLDDGPMPAGDIYHLLTRRAPREEVADSLRWLLRHGFIVIAERRGVHVTYALSARVAA